MVGVMWCVIMLFCTVACFWLIRVMRKQTVVVNQGLPSRLHLDKNMTTAPTGSIWFRLAMYCTPPAIHSTLVNLTYTNMWYCIHYIIFQSSLHFKMEYGMCQTILLHFPHVWNIVCQTITPYFHLLYLSDDCSALYPQNELWCACVVIDWAMCELAW